ncbi:MAG: 2-phospho-L-lactate/phosphoenolpyruvate guanylyltransferase [Frankiales bacterium]|nr:2-phospho-L-lactate/phosphoenolpyruvate guanylyltransferase [Frankiales bacterium]
MSTEPLQPHEVRWALLVPLKAPVAAKSRLTLASALLRTELVLAMAADVTAVALSCPRVALVLVVAESSEGLEPLQRMGATVVVDPSGQGLNGSLRYAAGLAAARDHTYGIASLVADVAGVTVDQLTRALDASASAGTAFVPDAAGRGTTFVAARQWGSFLPEYGLHSRRLHVEAGFTELVLSDATGLRLDVDTIADLAAVSAVGPGPRTRSVLARIDGPLQ